MATRDGSDITSTDLARKASSASQPTVLQEGGSRVRSTGWKPKFPRKPGKMVKVKQSVARTIMVYMSSSNTDQGLAGETLTITASKNGGAFSTITPTVTDRGGGWYSILLSTSHTDTIGVLALHITSTLTYANDDNILQVVGYDPDDAAQGLFPTGTVVTNGSNTALSFKISRTETPNDYWKDAYIVFTSGALIGQVKKITGYSSSTNFVTVQGGFTAAPSGGDAFYLINK